MNGRMETILAIFDQDDHPTSSSSASSIIRTITQKESGQKRSEKSERQK